jgi:integrase
MPRWGAVPLIDITRHDVKAWAASMKRAGLAPASVKRHVALFSSSLAAAVDAEVLTVNPAFRISIASGETDDDRFLTHAEADLLLVQFAPPSKYVPDHALIVLLFETGLRWGEAVGLRIERVDLDRRIIRVAEVWDSKLHQPKPYPKGRRRRSVPVPESLVPHLEPLLNRDDDELVFLSDGRPYAYSNFYHRRWLPAVERSGIGHTRIHDARHTYASWLLQAGVPLAEVGRLLGHVSWTTTQRYAHLAQEVPASVLAALNGPRGTNVGQRGTA